MRVFLFRATVVPGSQGSLFQSRLSPQEIVLGAIQEAPSVTVRRGVAWHIADVEGIGDTGVFFHIGKTRSEGIPKYDGRRFSEYTEEVAPYTGAILDIQQQLLAIVHNYRVSAQIDTVASRLRDALNNSSVVKDNGVRVRIRALRDPNNFIQKLKGSQGLYRFWYTIGRPNLDDVERDLVEPLQRIADELEGEGGHYSIHDRNGRIDREKCEIVARYSAVSNQDCGAVIKEYEEDRKKNIRLGKKEISEDVQDPESPENRGQILRRMSEIYHSIRERLQ